MRTLPLLLFFLAALPLASAQQSGGFSQFFNDTSDSFRDTGRDFVDAAGATTGLPTGVYRSVLDAFGPGGCGDDWISLQGGAGFVIDLWLVPAVMVAFIVVMGIGIIYMVGQLMNSPQLIALCKDELFQTAMTFIRVGFIAGMLVGGEMWYNLSASGSQDRIYSNPNNQGMMDSAMAFSRLMVSDMSSHYAMLLLYNTILHTIYSSTMWIGVTWRAMYSFNLGPVLKPLIDLVGSALQFLSLGMSEWLMHVVTLCIIKKWTWTLFIPAGMLLRAFPYTRSAGEALFALAFALAFFYPFMFLFDYEAHKLMVNNIADPHNAMSRFVHDSGIMGLFGSLVVIMLLMAGVFMPLFLGAGLTLAFELIRGSVYYIVMMSVLLPFLNIFITLTAAKETANFFRVDVNFMSFLKII